MRQRLSMLLVKLAYKIDPHNPVLEWFRVWGSWKYEANSR